jgi:hypothetical protein
MSCTTTFPTKHRPAETTQTPPTSRLLTVGASPDLVSFSKENTIEVGRSLW